MAKYECMVCGWVYDEDVGDPDSGIAAGTLFADIPDDWVCPMCGASKADFEAIEQFWLNRGLKPPLQQLPSSLRNEREDTQ